MWPCLNSTIEVVTFRLRGLSISKFLSSWLWLVVQNQCIPSSVWVLLLLLLLLLKFMILIYIFVFFYFFIFFYTFYSCFRRRLNKKKRTPTRICSCMLKMKEWSQACSLICGKPADLFCGILLAVAEALSVSCSRSPLLSCLRKNENS